MPHRQNIEVSMPLQAEFLPVATGCVEQSVQLFGLGRSEAMHLTLAVEEVYFFVQAGKDGGYGALFWQRRNYNWNFMYVIAI